jgi:FkbM family methyltransferase
MQYFFIKQLLLILINKKIVLMENIGESNLRNLSFEKKFKRESLIQSIIKNNKPIIFDVGAHKGESVIFFKKLFESSIIYSFEPDPDTFLELSKNILPNTFYYNFALSDKIGDAKFYRNNISHTNSLFKINKDSKDSIAINSEIKEEANNFLNHINNEFNVKTITLDSFIEDKSIPNIDLLKIDVQGAENLVLNGALKTLNHVKIIIIEVSFYDFYEKSTSIYDIEKIINNYGFKLFSISEISNNPMNGRTDWAEIIYNKF